MAVQHDLLELCKLTFFVPHSGIDDQTVRCVEELVLAAEELPAITEALRDLGLYARANRVSTVALTGDQVATVRSTFQCLICRG